MNIDEVYVIEDSGVPLYYYRGQVTMLDENIYALQSGFFTALASFGNEIGEGELKLIAFEEKTYALSQTGYVLVIYGLKGKFDEIEINEIGDELLKTTNHVAELLPTEESDIGNRLGKRKMDNFIDSFGNFLVREGIIDEPVKEKAKDFKTQLQSLLYKSIGYQPGVCNIGRSERLKRLTNGLLMYILTLVLYGFIIFLEWPTWLVFFLLFPLLIAFMQLFQYSFKFCVKNALSRQYNMN